MTTKNIEGSGFTPEAKAVKREKEIAVFRKAMKFVKIHSVIFKDKPTNRIIISIKQNEYYEGGTITFNPSEREFDYSEIRVYGEDIVDWNIRMSGLKICITIYVNNPQLNNLMVIA